MPDCAIYCRYSPRPEECESIPVQFGIIEPHIDKHGLTPVVVFFDENTSARKTKLRERPGGSEMLRFLKETGIKHVVCKSLDRMFRNTVDGLTQLELWEKQGIVLHDAKMGITVDVTNPNNEFITTILLANAKREAKETAVRTSDAMQHYQKQGRKMGRHPTFRYTERGRELVPLVRDRYNELGSYSAVARWLTYDQKIPGPTGNGWSHTMVKKLVEAE